MNLAQLTNQHRAEAAARGAGILRDIRIAPMRMTADDVHAVLRDAGARASHFDSHLVVATSPNGEALSAEIVGAGEWKLQGEWSGRLLYGVTVVTRADLTAALTGQEG